MAAVRVTTPSSLFTTCSCLALFLPRFTIIFNNNLLYSYLHLHALHRGTRSRHIV
ncbi:hypothetical protein GQ42DRAFT_19993 [Ramicandelaber brevisporus]|nr:hypothetical protein GQ42DRAFT_19993 [Ramicandelaber brevisporus]